MFDRRGEQSKQRKDNLLSEKTLSRTITHFIKNFFRTPAQIRACIFLPLLTIWLHQLLTEAVLRHILSLITR